VIQLNATQVTPALRALFNPPVPSHMRCFTVLEGSIVGDIWTDDAENPSWGIVRETSFGSTFIGGKLDAPLLSELITQLRRTADVVVSAYFNDPLIALLPTPFEYDGIAIDYTDRPLNQGLDAYLQAPEGCTVQRMDAALFERSASRDMNIAGCGSAEKALQQMVGFFLMKDDEIVCEAIAGPAAMGMREMGVETYEAHRQKGYATVTCAHLIHGCEQAGDDTLWNCAKQNLGSNALARKLGYRKAEEYRVIAWFKSK
jgi:RimJ/RimL family protein N-acetyltransferase